MTLSGEQLEKLTALCAGSASADAVANWILSHGTLALSNDDSLGIPELVIRRFQEAYEQQLDAELLSHLAKLLKESSVNQDSHVVISELDPSNEDPHNITSFLADGGIGRVWLARDQQVQREVVLKQLLPAHKENKEAQNRFIHEAQVTGNLQHPNIVPVYSMNWDTEQSPFYTMKYIRGETLADHIRRFHQPQQSEHRLEQSTFLLNCFISVCQALAYAHDQHYIHRDLKPENIAIGEFGEVTVLDWGLAQSLDADDSTSSGSSGVLGTPNYMPPEQASRDAGPTGIHSDIYSLGAILFEILCGVPPRDPKKQQAGLHSLLDSISAGDIPSAVDHTDKTLRGLAHIADKCLQTKPQDRYVSVTALLDDISHWRHDLPIVANPDSTLQMVTRKFRRNRRGLLASAVLIPTAMITLVVFLTNYKLESTNLSIAKRTEVSKQQEYLATKDSLEEAIRMAYEAKQEAVRNTALAKENTVLAAHNEQAYLLEKQRADDARISADNARKRADESTEKVRKSKANKDAAKSVADDNRKTSEALNKQLQQQVVAGFTQNASNAKSQGSFQQALAWQAQAIAFATASEMSDYQLSAYLTNYASIRSHIPALHAIEHTGEVRAFYRVHPAGNTVYTITQDGPTYRLTKYALTTLKAQWTHSSEDLLLRLAVSNNETLAVCARRTMAGKNLIDLFDPADGTVLNSAELPQGNINSLHIAGSNLLVTFENRIVGYELKSLEPVFETPLIQPGVTESACSADGRLLITFQGPFDVRIWDTTEGLLLSPPIRTAQAVIGYDFPIGSNRISLIFQNGSRKILNTANFSATSVAKGKLPLTKSEQITHVATHSHQLLTVYGTSHGRLMLSNASGSLFVAPIVFSKPVTKVQFSSDQRFLLIQTDKHFISLYDISKRELIYRELNHAGEILNSALSADNRFLMVAQTSGELRLWDLANSASQIQPVDTTQAYQHTQICSGNLLALTNNGQVQLRAITAPYVMLAHAQIDTNFDQTTTIITTDSGFYILSAKELHYFSTTNKQLIHTNHPIYAPVTSFSVSPGSNRLAIAHSDRTLSLHDGRDPLEFNRIDILKTTYRDLAWYSDDILIGLVDQSDPSGSTLEFIDMDLQERKDVLSLTYADPLLQYTQDGSPLLVRRSGELYTFEPDFALQQLPAVPTPLFSDTPLLGDFIIGNTGSAYLVSRNLPQRLDTQYPTNLSNTTTTGLVGFYSDDGFQLVDSTTGDSQSSHWRLPNNVRALHLFMKDNVVALFTASNEGLFRLELSDTSTSASDITTESLALSSFFVEEDVSLSRDPQAVSTAAHQYSVSHEASIDGKLSWLRNNSRRIQEDTWRPYLEQTTQYYEKHRGISTQLATQFLDELVLAQIGSRDYRDAHRSLIDGYQYTRQLRHLYQATILAAWLDDSTLYSESVAHIANRADLTKPQEFVYTATAVGLLSHQEDVNNVHEIYNQLKTRPTTNPILCRSILLTSLRQNDQETQRRVLKQLLSRTTPLPIRYFALATSLLQSDSHSTIATRLKNIRHIAALLPEINEGNPGKNWTERCLLDIAIDQLEDHLKGVPQE